MADNKDKTDKVEESAEPTYHVDRLIAEAEDFFGVAPEVVAGALYSERKQNFTRAEVEKATKQWLRQEVATEN